MSGVLPPASRPYRTRRSVRLLVLDPDGRLLLFSDRDHHLDGHWWITPGGGIEPGEREIDTAVRELAEETGLVLPAAQFEGPIATQRVVHGFSDKVTDQHDTWFLVRVEPFEIDRSGHTDQELVTMDLHTWLSPVQLPDLDQVVWPTAILQLLALAEDPGRWPVTLADAEESTVPVALGHLPPPVPGGVTG